MVIDLGKCLESEMNQNFSNVEYERWSALQYHGKLLSGAQHHQNVTVAVALGYYAM
jgi:hypothetical protein